MFEEPLYVLPEGIEPRWASAENFGAEKGKAGMASKGRKGSPCFRLDDGTRQTLAFEKSGSGKIRRIWIALSKYNAEILRGITLEFYWDNSENPAASVPIGDFFGMCLGRMVPFKSALFTSPYGRNFTSFIPMPFQNGMKIVVINNSGHDIVQFYYDIDYTVGDKYGKDVIYFHAWFNRENPTKLRKDYTILPRLEGAGRFLGVNIGIKCDMEHYGQSFWGEGEIKMYLDGDKEYPTLCGTGGEDYIGNAWGMNAFSDLYNGCQLHDFDKMEIGMYRYHIPDPIYFYKNIRVTFQQIGSLWGKNEPILRAHLRAHLLLMREKYGYSYPACEGRKALENGEIDIVGLDPDAQVPALYERSDDWSSCAYFYLNSPVNSLPLLPMEKRWI